MKIRIKQVDVFTDTPLSGNPAGLVIEADRISNEDMQKIAREVNASETVFVMDSSMAEFKMKFFTPNFEIDLCGHGIVGAFSALHEEGLLDQAKDVFYIETKPGILPVERTKINNSTVFMLTLAKPKFEEIGESKERIAEILGLERIDLLTPPPMRVFTGIWWLVVGVKSLQKLIELKPDQNAIEELSIKYGLTGITPFTLNTLDPGCSYHMRALAPLAGVKEDPVCGTGNGSVASYIAYHNLIPCQEQITLVGEQGIEVKRPGKVYAAVSKSGDSISTIRIGGTAVTALEGQILI